MRNKLIAGLLVVVVIIAAGVVWFTRASRNYASRSSIAVLPQTQPVNHILIVSPTKQADAANAFHFYSPLHDPPPLATTEKLTRWHVGFHATLLNEIKPDLAGPPLASIYAQEAAKANKGDVQAATTLFNGLVYCAQETKDSLNNEQELNLTIAHMQRTDTDRYWLPTDNLAEDIAQVQQLYHYCAGLTALENMYTIGHWASLAAQSGAPITQAWTAGFVLSPEDVGTATVPEFREKLRGMINSAAQAGIPEAWSELEVGYMGGGFGYPIDPVRTYASLYTEYMLTKSPDLIYQIWYLSQRLNPQQVEEGETLAHQNYQRIQSGL